MISRGRSCRDLPGWTHQKQEARKRSSSGMGTGAPISGEIGSEDSIKEEKTRGREVNRESDGALKLESLKAKVENAEGGRRKAEVGRQKSEVRIHRSEVGSQRSESGNSEVGTRNSRIR